MESSRIIFIGASAFGVLISAISQVILKKSSQKKYTSIVSEYMNKRVLFAYSLFFLATLLSVYSYKMLPVSMGALIDSTGYIYVTIFGAIFFREKIKTAKVVGLFFIIIGIMIYSFM